MFRRPVLWFIGLFAAMVLISIFVPAVESKTFGMYTIAWILNMLLMLVMVGLISTNKEQDPEWKRGPGGTQGSPGWFDILIDKRNKYSLSRFQIMLWTLVVMSAFLTMAIARGADSVSRNPGGYTCADCASPAKIELPEILWALMGISVTSAVASPLIKSSKEQRTKKDTDTYYKLKLTPAANGEAITDAAGNPIMVKDPNTNQDVPLRSNFTAEGAISKRVKGPPLISDMFMSEEAGSEYVLDIGKVQNFFFTMVAVLVYGLVLGAAIAGTKLIADLYQFPDLGEGLVAIIGISHAGYLVTKAAPTDTGPSP